VLSQVEYAKPDVLRRMAMNVERLARSLYADQLVSESWLMEKVTGVRARNADTTPSLVGSAVIDDLAALAIRLTDRAPIDSARADGGAFTLEQAAQKLGVGVRSIQRWRRLGLISMRFQFDRARLIGCSGAALAWFETHHPEMVSKLKRPAATQHARQHLRAQARLAAAVGGTLNSVAHKLAREEKISPQIARRILEQLEQSGAISKLKRRVSLPDAKAALAWRSWMRGVDLNTIARRLSQTRAATLRCIAKQRRRNIAASHVLVAPLSTFDRADAAETLLAPQEVRQDLAHGVWPTHPREFLAEFAPLVPARKNMPATDRVQLVALRFLLWHAKRLAQVVNAQTEWVDLDQCETALRWSARIRLALIQRAVSEALGRLQAIARAPLHSLSLAAQCQAIEIALDSCAAVLDQVMEAQPSDRAIRLGALAAIHVEQQAQIGWNPRARAPAGQGAELPDTLQLRCVPWLRFTPLRDDLQRVVPGESSCPMGRELLALRYGWQGRAPHTMKQAALALGIHPRQGAILAAKTLRALTRVGAK